jgi:lactoylglutathione lyase
LNAPNASEPNILVDVPEKHPGITHFALLCPDIKATKQRLEAAGIQLSGGLCASGAERGGSLCAIPIAM